MSKDRLDHLLLQNVLNGFGTKKAFVPMPGGKSAEPVAGASQATAAMLAPVGGAPGGAPQGQPPQGGAPQGQPGQMPPEIAQALQDPQIQQMLQQAGFIFDPNSGTLIDPATQQPMPPDQVAQVLQQIMSQGQQAPAQGDGQPPAGAGAPNGQGDPIIQLLTEIRDAVKGGGKGEGEKSKKQTTEEMMQSLIQELQRTNENLRSLTGQQ